MLSSGILQYLDESSPGIQMPYKFLYLFIFKNCSTKFQTIPNTIFPPKKTPMVSPGCFWSPFAQFYGEFHSPTHSPALPVSPEHKMDLISEPRLEAQL